VASENDLIIVLTKTQLNQPFMNYLSITNPPKKKLPLLEIELSLINQFIGTLGNLIGGFQIYTDQIR
jgi:hypothetical protein